MTPGLRDVIEEAYRVFAAYRPAGPLIACDCAVCMSEADRHALSTTPLRQITSELLAEYTNSAHGWDDGVIGPQMRYFLPRYLELIAAGDPPDAIGLSACLRRLDEAKWRGTWPAAEVAVLERFFDELVGASVHNLELWEWPVGWRLAFDFKALLTLIVTAGGDIDRALAVWDRASDPPAVIHMAALRSDVIEEHDRKYLHDAFLEDRPADADRIGAFLLRPEVDERIEAAVFATDDPRLQQILSDALRRTA